MDHFELARVILFHVYHNTAGNTYGDTHYNSITHNALFFLFPFYAHDRYFGFQIYHSDREREKKIEKCLVAKWREKTKNQTNWVTSKW